MSLLGKIVLILFSVWIGGQTINETYIGFRGIDRTNPTHHKQQLSFKVCDNYWLGPKNEENPKFTTLSLRPDVTTYLNDLPKAYRGMWQFKTDSDDLMLCATEDTIYKSGTIWTTLEAGLNDNPWEGLLCKIDPDVTRFYLCNGIDDNKKFVNGTLYDMQDQDDETTINPGRIWFVANTATATGDSNAIASIEAGQYIKTGTTADDTEWVEITTIESPTITFSKTYTGTTAAIVNAAVRSNDVPNSRHIVEYSGFVVLGATGLDETTLISNNDEGSYYILNSAYGVAQSFEATSSYFNKIALSIWRGSGTTGNIILKVKESLTSTEALATLTHPVSSLPTTAQKKKFDFGVTNTTIGDGYYITVERENGSTSPVYIQRGTAYANGCAFTTSSSEGFVTGWNTGLITTEIIPYDADVDDYDTFLNENQPDTTNSSSSNMQIRGSSIAFPNVDLKGVIKYPIEATSTKSDVNTFERVDIRFSGGLTPPLPSPVLGSFEVYRILVDNNLEQATWNNRLTATTWSVSGCSSSETDYTTTNFTTLEFSSDNSVAFKPYTVEVTALTNEWSVEANNNYGLLLTKEATFEVKVGSANNATTTKRPVWVLTALTGSTETSEDIYFEVIQDSVDISTVNYSKRYKPENFSDFNTFDVPGEITGMAVTGDLLAIGVKSDKDYIYFYKYTGETATGKGISDSPVAILDDMTFGSSKSISYLPMGLGLTFYSGRSVYKLNGAVPELLSGGIREEAKKFSNYRDPSDYYAGYADLMPQAVVLPTKNMLMLAVPNEEAKNSYLYNYNYALGAWTRWTGLYPTAMCVRNTGGEDEVLYMGMQDGQAYTLDTSGTFTGTATLEWYCSGPDGKEDITQNKVFDYMKFVGRADNPTTGCLVSLEVFGVDNDLDEDYDLVVADTTTDDKMLELKATMGDTAKEFKFRLTQVTTTGGISWRAIRYKYDIQDTD